jgi:hypothetical protein
MSPDGDIRLDIERLRFRDRMVTSCGSRMKRSRIECPMPCGSAIGNDIPAAFRAPISPSTGTTGRIDSDLHPVIILTLKTDDLVRLDQLLQLVFSYNPTALVRIDHWNLHVVLPVRIEGN